MWRAGSARHIGEAALASVPPIEAEAWSGDTAPAMEIRIDAEAKPRCRRPPLAVIGDVVSEGSEVTHRLPASATDEQ